LKKKGVRSWEKKGKIAAEEKKAGTKKGRKNHLVHRWGEGRPRARKEVSGKKKTEEIVA